MRTKLSYDKLNCISYFVNSSLTLCKNSIFSRKPSITTLNTAISGFHPLALIFLISHTHRSSFLLYAQKSISLLKSVCVKLCVPSEGSAAGCEREVEGCERGLAGCERGVAGCERGVAGCERGAEGCERGVEGWVVVCFMLFGGWEDGWEGGWEDGWEGVAGCEWGVACCEA